MARRHSKRAQKASLPDQLYYRRYLRKNKAGQVLETPDQMYRRVATVIAAEELRYGGTDNKMEALAEEFHYLMRGGFFIPNSPTLMNGDRENSMLSACFVLPIPDSIDGIFDAVKNTAMIQKAGGGTGFSFDRLRPTGDYISSSGGKTSGPVSFWRVLCETTNAIQQGAFRRGANMGMMSVHHPDILRFIGAKQNPAEFQNFNTSVKITDSFMQQLQDDPQKEHVVINPRTNKKYVTPRSVNIHNYTVDDLVLLEQAGTDCYTVADIWNLIVTCAHATGEPGVAFIDRINRDNPTPQLGAMEATNPCGEQPLLPHEACNLGSINLSKYIDENRSGINWDALGETVKLTVRFLDNVIDANYYPIPQIEKITRGNRKIGLGVMGFHDALILLGIRYDSDQAMQVAEKLMAFIQEQARKASEELAEERGCFPNWKGSLWDTAYHRPMRNATVTTIAPTGTISLLAGCSSGIEPIFSLATRRTFEGREFIQLHPLIEELGRKDGWLTSKIRQALVKGISPMEIPNFPKPLAEVLVTAHEVTPEWHVKIQAAFQAFTDNAVSKTVNLRADATIGDTDKVYRLAYRLGCKGITVYRDGSRQGQVLTATGQAHNSAATTIESPRPRTRVTHGLTSKFRMGCGTLFVTVNHDEQGLCEVFANLGKAGGCPSQTEATCRIVSAALRSGVNPKVLIEQLKSIRCLSTLTRRKDNHNIDVLSCPDAIAKALEEALGQEHQRSPVVMENTCPECGQILRYESGCDVCSCGYSSCG